MASWTVRAAASSPIIGFGQEDASAPRGGYQWLSYLLIVTGWVLATTTAAGISRSLSRQ
ncbi:hypothetical protein ACH4TX_09595 [Streptomyces sp. NPDC021098]|uniref:hypothetical protein n=1 Tax=unclassified Streptomyces TaxID=2593676 RepID=UPI0037BB7487